MKQAKTDSSHRHMLLFLTLAGFFLLVSPYLYHVQDIITRVLGITGISLLLTHYIIPLEIISVRGILSILRISTSVLGDNKTILLHRADSTAFAAQLTWSCIGWESLLCLLVSLLAGIDGHYTRSSKLMAIALGLLGTIGINLLRITLVCLMGFFFGNHFTVIYHNYFGAALVLVWLFVYWWLCYAFILKTKETPHAWV
jgi:exosortase/archaeosortase family protein